MLVTGLSVSSFFFTGLSRPSPVVGVGCGALLLALDVNRFCGCVVVLEGNEDRWGVGGMKLMVGGFVDSAGVVWFCLSVDSSLLEAVSVAVIAGVTGGKENVGFVAGPVSLFAEAKGWPNGLLVAGASVAVGGLNEEANGFNGCAGPEACVWWKVASVLAGTLLGSAGVDADVAGANGLPTGCLAAEARPEAKGFCCGVGCCTAKPLVGVIPLNAVPELPLTALLFPQGPPDELGNEKGLGVVALGPLGIGGLLVAW
jgi:hypothetical protein